MPTIQSDPRPAVILEQLPSSSVKGMARPSLKLASDAVVSDRNDAIDSSAMEYVEMLLSSSSVAAIPSLSLQEHWEGVLASEIVLRFRVNVVSGLKVFFPVVCRMSGVFSFLRKTSSSESLSMSSTGSDGAIGGSGATSPNILYRCFLLSPLDIFKIPGFAFFKMKMAFERLFPQSI